MVCPFPGLRRPGLGQRARGPRAVVRGPVPWTTGSGTRTCSTRSARRRRGRASGSATTTTTSSSAEFGGVTAFDELLRRTDPGLVTIELDCGWVKVAGLDPADFIAKHADRVGLLHVKDMKAGPAALHPVRSGRPVRGSRPRLDRLAQGLRGRQGGGRQALLCRAGHHRAAPAGGDQDQPRLPARPEGRVIGSPCFGVGPRCST